MRFNLFRKLIFYILFCFLAIDVSFSEGSVFLQYDTFNELSPENIETNYKKTRVIKVGYFEQHGIFDESQEGVSGYAVDLLSDISRYTGWEFQWIKIPFSELEQRLNDGSIDLSCGVSRTEEYVTRYSFSNLCAGYRAICLHVPTDSNVYYMDISAFEGMKIGFFNDPLQYQLMQAFARQQGFSFRPVFFGESREAMEALSRGEIDGYVDNVLSGINTKVVAPISITPFFFVSRVDDNEIMPLLDEALRQIFLKHPSHIASLFDSYIGSVSDTPVVYSRDEVRWLETKPVLRVAYSLNQDMMDVSRDGSNFLISFFELLEKQSGITFQYIPFSSYKDCLRAVADGKADLLTNIYPEPSFLHKYNVRSSSIFYNAPISILSHKNNRKLPGKGGVIGGTEEMLSVMNAYKSAYPRDSVKIFSSIEECRAAFESRDLDFYIPFYPGAHIDSSYPENCVMVRLRAEYPMAIGISYGTSPFAISILDKVIASINSSTIDSLLLSSSSPSVWKQIRTWIFNHIWEVLGSGIAIVFLIGILIIRNNKKQLAIISKAAYVDPLTQGPNRSKFILDASRLINEDKRRRYLSVVNICRLKFINRICGLKVGDELIVFCSREFGLRTRSDELSAHKGTGQYLLLWNCKDDTEYTRRINDLFSVADVASKHFQHTVSFSCGVYCIDDKSVLDDSEQEEDDDKLERRVKLYQLYAETAEAAIVERDYRSQFLMYDESMAARQLKATELENRMVEALERREFSVFIQPQIYLSNMKLHGGEALVRWLPPDGKPIYPDEFIPLFEKNGFIRELDLFVLDTVCAWIRKRLNEGKKVTPISVNQSSVLFFRNDYVEIFLAIVKRYKVPPYLLRIEVTESMAWLDEAATIRTLKALHQVGIGLNLDDFGKGYSSLSTMHSFDVDIIKLDKAFLGAEPKKQRSAWVIIYSLVEMAHRLNIEILCEGVETKKQLERLQEIDCKYGQGYLFSRPLSLKDFEKYVDEHELEELSCDYGNSHVVLPAIP